jgi:hypothetical protein
MSTTEYDATKTGAPTAVEERHETIEETRNLKLETRDCSAGADVSDDRVLGRDEPPPQDQPPTRNVKLETRNCTALCHHVMESGFYCQSPALGDRRYCYSHLRLRGQRLLMARAIAKRLPYRFDMPALDDLFAVQVAVEHVARALGAGLLERRQAGTLLYALQQSAINHRILALLQLNAPSVNPALSPKEGEEGAGAPPYSPVSGERMGSYGDQKRLVEEYPQFETEYGLPAGLDLSQPAHLVFPPPERVWQVVPAPPMVARPHRKRWTRETIELEHLHLRREQIGAQAFNQQAHQLQDRISTKAYAEFRKRQDAVWQAEAERRNAAEEAKDQEYTAMDEAQRRAYHLGVLRGLEAAQEQAEEEAQKKPAAKAAVGS